MASIDKLPSGKWRAQVRLPNGKRPSRTDPLKSVVKRWAEELEAQIRRGDYVDPTAGRMTVAQWHAIWWPPPTLAEKTLAAYASKWRKYGEPYWGRWQMAAVRRTDVVEWCRGLDGSVRVTRRINGVKTVKTIALNKLEQYESDGWECMGRTTRAHEIARNFMSAMFRDAVGQGVIGSNPFEGVRPARSVRKPPRWFTKDEAARLLAAMPTEGDRLMVDLDLHVGLRWEELVALRGLRVDQLRKVIVVQDVMDLSGLREYPKTDSSAREVPIPPHLVEPILRRAKADLSGFLFTAPRGGPLVYSNWRSRVWLPATKTAGVAGTPHHMRHTAASWLVQDGVDLVRVQALLGHESYATTRVYSHLDPRNHDAIMDSWRRDSPETHEPPQDGPGEMPDEGTHGS